MVKITNFFMSFSVFVCYYNFSFIAPNLTSLLFGKYAFLKRFWFLDMLSGKMLNRGC